MFSSFLNLTVCILGVIATDRQFRAGSAGAEYKEKRTPGGGDMC